MKLRLFSAAALSLAAVVAATAFTAGSEKTVTTTIGPFTVMQVAEAVDGTPQTPEVAEVTARNAALDAITVRRPDVHGLRIASANLAQRVTKAATQGGFTFTQTDPGDFWLIELDAPAQQGFEHVVALAVVDASTGEIVANSVGAYND